MNDSLDIAAVVRLTGLSSRALRFYEARGLLRPLRTYSGRRRYGPVELERIHQIITLKRAGLSIADIQRLTVRGPIDFAALIDTQIAAVGEQSAKLEGIRALLISVKSRVERSEPIDVATFCSLIQQGEKAMSSEGDAWKALADRYMDEEARADFAATQPFRGGEFDQAEYSARWAALTDRIRAAMPMDPADPAALTFVRDWFTLLAPFSAVATPAMWEGTRAMYNDVDQWRGEGCVDPGFDGAIWRFINSATEAARARGDDIGPAPEWMTKEGQPQCPKR